MDSQNKNNNTENLNAHLFNQEVLTEAPKRGAWKWMLPLSLVLAGVMFAAWHFEWHVKAVTAGVLMLAVISHVVTWILGIIVLVPIVGPLIVKVLSLSIIWLLNAIGYLVSYTAIKRGYSKDVLTYRALTIALLTGIVIGFVIGSLV